MNKLFTKSAFKIALECPNRLYYYRNPDKYENTDLDDEFLASLADGGFQVGALAKIYCDVPEENDVKEKDYAGALNRTQVLMKQENVIIAEAAFRYGNLFVRVDVLKKKGNEIELIEVKAKSWSPDDKFVNKNKSFKSDIRPYVYDVAFQKYVVMNALKELYPDNTFTVTAKLMMADKSKVADIDGINQMFKIVQHNGQTEVEVMPGAIERIKESKVKVLTAFDVDDCCNSIIAETSGEQGDKKWMLGKKFKDFVGEMSACYCNNEKKKWDINVSVECFKCPYYVSKHPDMKDGYKECWKSIVKFEDKDFDEPLVKDLWGGGNTHQKSALIENKIYKMNDIRGAVNAKSKDKKEIIPAHVKDKGDPGLDYNERKWLQIALSLNDPGLFEDTSGALDFENKIYLDVEGLNEEMEKWKFPLHMIDFETTTVALPYYKGMKPYEQVAFQFSHHIIEKKDGTYSIRHAGQYLNEDVTKFPNFEFVRELKSQLEKDDGSIFRYATHENTILNCIKNQLEDSDEKDKKDLIDFIRKITHNSKKENGEVYEGERDMIDLLEVVKRYFYKLDEMGGKNSIKNVLPAVLNASKFLQEKYSKNIYGSEIESKNIKASEPISWIVKDAEGKVDSPYHQLPSVRDLLKLTNEQANYIEMHDEEEDFSVANGGAALTAYNKLMFCKDDSDEDAIRSALLRYCELDTMAMVFIWEYFNHECDKKKEKES